MKNSLTRLLQMHRNRKRFNRAAISSSKEKSTSSSGLNSNLSTTLNNLDGLPDAINQNHQLTGEFLEDLKAKILALI